MSTKTPHDWFRQTGGRKAEAAPEAAPDAEPTAIEIDLDALARRDAEAFEEEDVPAPEPDRSTLFLSEEGPPPGVEPLPRKPATPEQTRSIVDRLEDVIAEYCRHGVRIGVAVKTPTLLSMLDDAIASTGGRERARVAEGGTAQDFFVEGLYDELIDQPANIFDRVTYTDGKQYWVPLAPETWTACLRELRQRILDEADT